MHLLLKVIHLLALPGAIALLAASASIASSDDVKLMSADQIKQAVIQESIASYPGHCPCPYNHASNGSMCGKRSAWSKPGGYAPICYPNEVTPEMMRQWEQQHGYTVELKNLQKVN